MSEKSAFIFDTNFIIENLNLKDVVINLSDKFTVYVTQVSIDERISQKYLELKSKYDKLKQITREYKGIATIKTITQLEEQSASEERFTQKGYVDLFGNNIIPFASDNVTFAKILDRVYKKIPPFLSVEGASDKGFKDSLIWISLLDYFKNNGESEIIFVTNDNGFRKNATELCAEFQEFTGKNIIIKDNSYYKNILENTISLPEHKKVEPQIPDVNQLRERIQEVMHSICGFDSEDYWGNPDWVRTFTLNKKVDSLYMEIVFSRLRQSINNRIFETQVPANEVLELDERVTNNFSIPMSSLENALTLYEDIKQNLQDFLPQFYSAAASIVNSNYSDSQDDSDDLPF